MLLSRVSFPLWPPSPSTQIWPVGTVARGFGNGFRVKTTSPSRPITRLTASTSGWAGLLETYISPRFPETYIDSDATNQNDTIIPLLKPSRGSHLLFQQASFFVVRLISVFRYGYIEPPWIQTMSPTFELNHITAGIHVIKLKRINDVCLTNGPRSRKRLKRGRSRPRAMFATTCWASLYFRV